MTGVLARVMTAATLSCRCNRKVCWRDRRAFCDRWIMPRASACSSNQRMTGSISAGFTISASRSRSGAGNLRLGDLKVALRAKGGRLRLWCSRPPAFAGTDRRCLT